MIKNILFLLFLGGTIAHAQNVSIKGTVKNFTAKEVSIIRLSKGFFYDYFKESNIVVPIKYKKFQVTFTINQPEILLVFIKGNEKSKSFQQILFVKKGYDLNIGYEMKNDSVRANVVGKGSMDNQLLPVNILKNYDVFNKNGATVPYPVFNYIVNEHKKDSTAIASYTRKYKPSEEFINTWKYQLKYQVLGAYYDFSENYKFSIRDAYARKLSVWKGLQDSLFASVSLSDDKAMAAPVYQELIRIFLLRKKEGLWTEAWQNKTRFLQDWYGMDTIAGEKLYREDMKNRLVQKIINRYFTGKPKEYAYAILFETAIQTSDVKNMEAIYTDYVNEFPQGLYRSRFQPEFNRMFERTRSAITDKMIFVKNGSEMKTWEEVLTLVKGKTVLLDMWGTWCGPCREEMDKNSQAIKDYFKGKGLDYLYVANNDVGQDKKWKELIAYFKLEGYHILANEKLTSDIDAKIKLEGYPTYAIIHSDGSFELSKAGYPMNRQKLIEQIEEILKK